MYENYAISIGHNPNSVAFSAIVEKMEDLAKYIARRKMDPEDSMYEKPTTN